MTSGEEFERGHAAGEISQRLREHDRHFDQINGSLNRVADKLGDLTLAVQRLDDRMTTNLATVSTTAEAVEKEREATARAVEKEQTATRDASERRWTPMQRLLAVLAVLAGVAGAAVAIYAAAAHK